MLAISRWSAVFSQMLQWMLTISRWLACVGRVCGEVRDTVVDVTVNVCGVKGDPCVGIVVSGAKEKPDTVPKNTRASLATYSRRCEK